MSTKVRALSRLLLLLAALVAPLRAGDAHATTIDFETILWPSDGMPLDGQYLAGHYTSFALDTDGDGIADPGAYPLLEQVGPDDGWAFVNDVDSSSEKAWPGYEEQLGAWTLALPTHGPGVALLVAYDVAMRLVAGDIWDIDGNAEQGTEQWRLDALAADGSVLESILSPLGESLDADGLNAKPWHYAFDREGADIWALRIDFVGSKTWGLGVAFDGFSSDVPEPGTLSLLALGAALLGTARRHRVA